MLHPTACGEATAAATGGAGDVRERGAVGALVLGWRGLVGWGGRRGAACGGARGRGPGPWGPQGGSAHGAAG